MASPDAYLVIGVLSLVRRGLAGGATGCRAVALGLGQSPVQPLAHLLGGVGAAYALLPRDGGARHRDPDDTGQAQPSPPCVHVGSVTRPRPGRLRPCSTSTKRSP